MKLLVHVRTNRRYSESDCEIIESTIEVNSEDYSGIEDIKAKVETGTRLRVLRIESLEEEE